MSVIGVVPQQAVHVCVKKSYDDLLMAEPLNQISTGSSQARVDPSHHPVVSDISSQFIGVLPDNAAIHDTNKSTKRAISVQVSGLCSACIAYDNNINSLVAGMPLLFNNKIGLYVDDAAPTLEPVGKFIDLVEEEIYPEHPERKIESKIFKFYHAIIHLSGIAQKDPSTEVQRFSLQASEISSGPDVTEVSVKDADFEAKKAELLSASNSALEFLTKKKEELMERTDDYEAQLEKRNTQGTKYRLVLAKIEAAETEDEKKTLELEASKEKTKLVVQGEALREIEKLREEAEKAFAKAQTDYNTARAKYVEAV